MIDTNQWRDFLKENPGDWGASAVEELLNDIDKINAEKERYRKELESLKHAQYTADSLDCQKTNDVKTNLVAEELKNDIAFWRRLLATSEPIVWLMKLLHDIGRVADVIDFQAGRIEELEKENTELRATIDSDCPIGAFDLATTWKTEKITYMERIDELETALNQILRLALNDKALYGLITIKRIADIASKALNKKED